ncbi:MAG: YiiX/YebB-like N1pC/P60 family cysteine hydrolase [Acidobacteriota bacterium]
MVARQFQFDLTALHAYRQGLRQTLDYLLSRDDLIPSSTLRERRVLPRELKEELWRTWLTLLDFVVALDALAQPHRSLSALRDPARRARALCLLRGAFLAQYRSALEFIEAAERDPGLDVVLDDPAPQVGLPPGSYGRFKLRFLNVARASEFAALESLAGAASHSADCSAARAAEEDARAIWAMGAGPGPSLTIRNALALVRKAGFASWLPIQRGVSTWMSRVRLRRPDAWLIQRPQARELLGRVLPGDILLERREWCLTNVGIPGYWTHAALYVGTAEERSFLASDPGVAAWVHGHGIPEGELELLLRRSFPAAYARSLEPSADGECSRIIEALRPGVIFNSLEASAACDALAVLRPRLPLAARAAAVARAFQYAGLPYDYSFEFLSDSAMVCTELVAKAYAPKPDAEGLRLPLLEVAGRRVTPANELVRLFDDELGRKGQQLDLVAFLDGSEKLGRAVEKDQRAFRSSWRRPKWHILMQDLADRS